MAMKKVSLGSGAEGAVTYVKAKDLSSGTKISGTYIRSFVDQFENLGHTITLADGNTTIINGTGKLDKLLAEVPKGSLVEITYLGKVTLNKGKLKGKAIHDFEVSYDDSAIAKAAVNSELPV